MNEPGTHDNFFILFAFVQRGRSYDDLHSNVGEEWISPLIITNKTPRGSSLKQIGTLSSMLVTKTHTDNPLQWTSSDSLLQEENGGTNANTH